MIQIKKKIKIIIILRHQKMFKNRNELNKIFIKYLEKNFLDNF